MTMVVSESKTRLWGRRILIGTPIVVVLILLFMADAKLARIAQESIDGWLGHLLSQGSFVPLLAMCAMVAGAFELMKLQRAAGARPFERFALVMVALLVLIPWFTAAGWLGESSIAVEGLFWPVLGMIVAVVGTGMLCVRRDNPQGSLRDFGATLLPICFLGFLGSFGIQIRCERDLPAQFGVWLALSVVLIAKTSDIGAFFAGTAFGKHRLAPGISPGKTIEGAVAGLLSGAIVSVLLISAGDGGSSLRELASTTFGGTKGLFAGTDPTTNISIAWSAIFGVLVAGAGQLGDLIESCFKRDAQAKDSGTLLPSFGGILDLVDSLLVALPVAWVLMTLQRHVV